MKRRTIGISRRLVIGGVLAALATPLRAATRRPTVAQSTGPYYPESLPLDADADLVQVAGQARRAAGDVLHLFGRIETADGRAVAGAQVEIWQCDAAGRYHHPRDPRGGDKADPAFQGFGKTVTDADGAFRFRTIVPVSQPGRTPHVHFLVRAPGRASFVTQMYLKDHPANAADVLFRRVRDAADRARLSVALERADDVEAGAQRCFFEIVLA